MGYEQRKIATDLCWGEELLKHQVLNDLNTAKIWELADADPDVGSVLNDLNTAQKLGTWERAEQPSSPAQLQPASQTAGAGGLLMIIMPLVSVRIWLNVVIQL